MRILVKFPTRSRPKQFLKVLNLLNEKATDRNNINYLVTVDSDDPTMSNIENEINVNNVTISRGKSDSKIHACNRDMIIGGWDIVVLMSDDMIPQVEGWDDIIRLDMDRFFPNLNGTLWYNDGYQDRICTLCILGKKYYDHFGYIYHPDYHSLFVDNEFTEVAQYSGKMNYSPQVLFSHEHFANKPGVKRDSLYDRNEALFNLDKVTYERRKAEGFPNDNK